MARVNLEERFFAEGRLFRFARSIGFPVQTVIGMLAFLWHDSQEMGEHQGDATSICEWMRLHEIQTAQTLNFQWEFEKLEEAVIESLVECRYISEVKDGIYEIHGNAEQLDKLDKWAKRAKKAADARWHHGDDATSIAQASPKALLKHMQSDALQFNTIQDSTVQITKGNRSPKLTPENLKALTKQFGKAFLDRHLKDAVACWETYPEHRRLEYPLIRTVQGYLKNKRDDLAKAEAKANKDKLPKNIGDKLYHPPLEAEVEAL